MSTHATFGNEVTTGRRKPSDLVAEYEAKIADVPHVIASFGEAQSALRMAGNIGGTWGNITLNTGNVDARDMERSLLRSAWRHCYGLYALENFASAKDKSRLARMFEDPPAFTVDNIRDQFGQYIVDPWGSILRGLAEVFCDLDPAYRSHEKVKIGAKGLPKRVILSGVSDHGMYGRDRLISILNALAAYQGKPLVTHVEIASLLDDGDCLREDTEICDPYSQRQYERDIARGWSPEAPKKTRVPGRGVWLKRFANGNGHLFFSPDSLSDINRALAEFYGDVLPDETGEEPTKPRTSTAVSKDLQYYPTPADVVERVLGDFYVQPGTKILEPSCGCGRFLDALRSKGADVFGIEYDASRASEARAKGHKVLTANFLSCEPSPDYARVVMNPPFAGRHYVKHVRHALRFLEPGGVLTAILPATARYDHGELDDLNGSWHDLPVGSFRESGTNINTVVLTVRVKA